MPSFSGGGGGAAFAADTTAVDRLVTDPADAAEKQILFGDLHVHTTFSADAFLRSLPLAAGRGRASAGRRLRLRALLLRRSTSGASTTTPRRITPRTGARRRRRSAQCNAVAGDPREPGRGRVPRLGVDAGRARRPTTTTATRTSSSASIDGRPRADAADQRARRQLDRRAAPARRRSGSACAPAARLRRTASATSTSAQFQRGAARRAALPGRASTRASCRPTATRPRATPRELFEKLDAVGLRLASSSRTARPGASTRRPARRWDKQLTGAQHDPDAADADRDLLGPRQLGGVPRLARDRRSTPTGEPLCPTPTARLPAVLLARRRDHPRALRRRGGAAECEQRVADARASTTSTPASPASCTVPGRDDRGLARLRASAATASCPRSTTGRGSSAQYALAISNFDDPRDAAALPLRLHRLERQPLARVPAPATRSSRAACMTEARGAARRDLARARPAGARRAPRAGVARRRRARDAHERGFQLLELERQASFFMTGGLVAVHAAGRDRDAIWDALERREVYGTSGERILLWFDLLNAPGGARCRWAARSTLRERAALPRARRRRVRAAARLPGVVDAGARRRAARAPLQGRVLPPDATSAGASTRIEVVRIRPQARAGEPVARADRGSRGAASTARATARAARVEFDDPDFAAGGRDAVYYVRAIQEPTPAVNAGELRCERDADGDCVEVHPCYGDYRTPVRRRLPRAERGAGLVVADLCSRAAAGDVPRCASRVPRLPPSCPATYSRGGGRRGTLNAERWMKENVERGGAPARRRLSSSVSSTPLPSPRAPTPGSSRRRSTCTSRAAVLDRPARACRRLEEVGARDVLAVGRVLLAELLVLVLVESDHHELLRLSRRPSGRGRPCCSWCSAGTTRCRRRAVPASWTFSLPPALLVRAPLDLRVVPVAARERRAGEASRDSGEQHRHHQLANDPAANRCHFSHLHERLEVAFVAGDRRPRKAVNHLARAVRRRRPGRDPRPTG